MCVVTLTEGPSVAEVLQHNPGRVFLAAAGLRSGQGWEDFTSAALAALVQQRSGIVFLLWGRWVAGSSTAVWRSSSSSAFSPVLLTGQSQPHTQHSCGAECCEWWGDA